MYFWALLSLNLSFANDHVATLKAMAALKFSNLVSKKR